MNIIPLLTHNFDPKRIIDEIAARGATSVRLLDEPTRLLLLKEARSYAYQDQGQYSEEVRQELSSYYVRRTESLFSALKISCENMLWKKFSSVYPYPFQGSILFNEAVIQRYKAGSVGITPHVDFARCRNLIVVFIIEGRARFYTCDNRQGDNPQEIDATPGNAIFMRAAGFQGSGIRPFHFITDIKEERFSFGLRQMTN